MPKNVANLTEDDRIAALEALPRPVAGYANDYPSGAMIARHAHRRAQLLYAAAGVMQVRTDLGIWVVPPQRAVWIPGGVPHEIRCIGRVRMRTLYVDGDVAPGLPGDCRVVDVPPLLRELVLAAMSLPPLYELDGPDGRLIMVILDQLRVLDVAPLHLPMPSHPRLTPIVEALLMRPEDRSDLDSWGVRVGASGRTLARLFTAETGMSFGAWRQQARLLAALTRLAAGETVTAVALDLGYDSLSAFIAMFRRATGTTPGRYFAR